MQDNQQSHRSDWLSKAAIALGAIFSLWGALTWTTAVRSFVRVFRFGIDSYIGSSNLGRGIAETLLGVIGMALGWLLVRKRLSKELVRRVFFIALAIVVVLGIISASSE
jgi:hypothetical protein